MYRVATFRLISDMSRIFLKTHGGQHESKRDTAIVWAWYQCREIICNISVQYLMLGPLAWRGLFRSALR